MVSGLALLALYRPKRKWRLASQQDPLDYLEQTVAPGGIWRRNYSSLAEYEGQVLEVMRDQAIRGLVLTEFDARKQYPDLVIASLCAQRKEKPGGNIRARVLLDGTHGLCVNSRTRLRVQERAPIVADLKRTMRKKAKIDELTFAFTADVTEAHRQVPIHPDDGHLLGCQVIPGGEVFIVGVLLLVPSRGGSWTVGAVSGRRRSHNVAYVGYLLECGGSAYRRGLLTFSVLRAVIGSSPLMAQDIRPRCSCVGGV